MGKKKDKKRQWEEKRHAEKMERRKWAEIREKEREAVSKKKKRKEKIKKIDKFCSIIFAILGLQLYYETIIVSDYYLLWLFAIGAVVFFLLNAFLKFEDKFFAYIEIIAGYLPFTILLIAYIVGTNCETLVFQIPITDHHYRGRRGAGVSFIFEGAERHIYHNLNWYEQEGVDIEKEYDLELTLKRPFPWVYIIKDDRLVKKKESAGQACPYDSLRRI